MTPENITIYTLGHSSRTIDSFLGMLRAHGIQMLVDIRSWPASRRFPHFAKAALEQTLSSAGIAYVWEKALGGKRPAQPGSDIHSAISEGMFRAYVEHLHGPEAKEAIERLLSEAAKEKTAVMCAERDPARCHRRFLADRLIVVHSVEVIHIIDEAESRRHEKTESLSVQGERLVYAAPVQMALPELD